MILVDFSSTMHRMIYASSKECEIQEDGKYITEDFIYLTKYLIIQEMYNIHNEHKNKFGELVLCLDNAQGGYWRKDYYNSYKLKRSQGKDYSPYKWDEIFKYINELIDMIRECLPWKIVSVPRAEADDIMLVLSRHYNKSEKILIYSPDKDMIQAQRNTNNVFQYSALTKKWIIPENKHENMDDWLMEHVCLGDASDEVPRIVDETIFSDNFKNYLKSNDIKIKIHSEEEKKEIEKIVDTPMEFELLNENLKNQLLSNYNIYKTNKKGEETELDIYLKERIGLSTLKKKIDKIGSLEKFLDSHPLYRKNYNRNYILVMEEGIPSEIWNECLVQYKDAKSDLIINEFEKFLDKYNLSSLKLTITFELNRELTIEDFGW